ncbi:YqkE family protein [Paenibacillus koleovorans]|uniref:YqkE family protein n=1 Tax=Paenibacillus koleovorans TaxID=121608 RepID=UPI000FD80257|nr:YqkE family protein [Paenibacillus koleovorans]
MSKRKKQPSHQAGAGRREPQKRLERQEEKAATLKDLLNPAVVEKLKAQADQMKADEEAQKQEARRLVEEARKAEQKRLENDFAHLLNTSGTDWRKYK